MKISHRIGSSWESVPLKSNTIARGRPIGRETIAVPLDALALALAAAFLHAFWNLLIARAKDPEAATAVALLVALVAYAPIAALTWRIEPAAIPYIVVTSFLQLGYVILLAAAYVGPSSRSSTRSRAGRRRFSSSSSAWPRSGSAALRSRRQASAS